MVVAMNADNAGRSAATRIGEQLRRTGLDVRIALLPNGSDPCEYLSNAAGGVEAFRHDHAVPLTVHVEQAIAEQGDQMQWIEGRLGAARAITGYLATYPPSYAARQVGWLADTLDLHHTKITRELATAYEERRAVPAPEAQQPTASLVR